MKKIKIVYIETNCKKNGPINQTLYIIKHLDRNLFQPYLVTVWDEEENNSILKDYLLENVKHFCCHLTKYSSLFLGSNRIKSILYDIKPDIIHSIGMPLYRMSLPYTNAYHFTTIRNYCYDDYPDYYTYIVGKIMAFLDICLIKKSINKSGYFITCSESLSNIYKTKEKIKLPFIRNGIDLNSYFPIDNNKKIELRLKLNIPLNKYIFIYSGVFNERKNQEEAIKAFVDLSDSSCFLILLGNGKNLSILKERYKDQKNIMFAGNVKNVSEYLHSSDAYISSSKSEGLPNGVLEAMSCGLPILLSNIDQHVEILDINSNCGFLYTLGDIGCFSNKMKLLINSNQQTMSSTSYDIVTNYFSSTMMSESYQKLYLNIINNMNIY